MSDERDDACEAEARLGGPMYQAINERIDKLEWEITVLKRQVSGLESTRKKLGEIVSTISLLNNDWSALRSTLGE